MDLVWEQASVQESSGPLLANTSELTQIRYELDLACLQRAFKNRTLAANTHFPVAIATC